LRRDGSESSSAYRLDDFFLPPDFRLLELFLPLRLRGTFAPFLRASDSPIAIACLRLLTLPPFPPRPDFSVPFLRRRIALSTRFDAAFPYLRFPEDFRAAMPLLRSCSGQTRFGAHGARCATGKRQSIDPIRQSNSDHMRSRTGLEAEAINRLTEGVQPAVMRAILVQCLAGEVAPSVAISRMLAEGAAHTVRAAIDEVTHKAATVSRASDMLVHDRVDELTQVFVENAAALADVRGAAGAPNAPRKRATNGDNLDEAAR
jgi:hypothetical protein